MPAYINYCQCSSVNKSQVHPGEGERGGREEKQKEAGRAREEEEGRRPWESEKMLSTCDNCRARYVITVVE